MTADPRPSAAHRAGALPHPAEPVAVFVQDLPGGALTAARPAGTGRWAAGGIEVALTPDGGGAARVRIDSATTVSRVAVRWTHTLAEDALILGDAWERGYGDLQWRHLQSERLLPWYWLAHTPGDGVTTGFGVDVAAGAFCSWSVDQTGFTLWLDARSGGGPTTLAGRTLEAATVRRFGGPDAVGTDNAGTDATGSPWRAAHLAVATMASPLTRANSAVGPVVGANNWYYAYGTDFDEAAVLTDARTVVELADGHPVRPFSVIDAGWSPGGVAPGGPWDAGLPGVFDDMAATAARITEIGARPGLWTRPLLERGAEPRHTALGPGGPGEWALDPSAPDVLAGIEEDFERYREWGYELVKHDFSTYDTFGRFGPEMGASLTDPGRRLADSTRTTAEVLVALYRRIREAAGDMVVIGCNTVGHLAAGLEDVHRTGDDTSGHDWERTRRMGVNTLAFRMPQHGRFFMADADCVPSTPHTPWERNRVFLDLIARSGTALFCSIDPATRTDAVDADLRAALRLALDGGESGGIEPLDWLSTTTPRRWRTADGDLEVDWTSPWGVQPGAC
ncbi:hypothetical protein OCAE111667_25995 [Occultella aeris]|uniref:Alpha-galactosidase n=1 Tax=Occultella aeris TaxID=2761496 RepID=A0A7M4DKX8_9MICO|nr:hypothetical protein [Occultella aeris]VZO37863.1 hypothetical protein HALOF300_02793 [Occultella aeris]